MSMTTNKQTLRNNAESIIGILENIAGFEPSDIDGDSVELRFEDERGYDTGCVASIVEQCQKAADVVITALAGTNEDVHPDNSTKMVQLYDDLNDHYAPPKVVRELARIALASLEAEPVAHIIQDKADRKEGNRGQLSFKSVEQYHEKDINEHELTATPLYTAPPAPVSVPTFDEWLEIRGNKPLGWVKDAMRESYDACRAAMQGKAEPVSQPSTLRDGVESLRASGISIDAGKIMAERDALNSPVIPDGWVMAPVEPTFEMRSAGHKHFNAMIDTCGDFTPIGMYKAMIAAAPQQGVKP